MELPAVFGKYHLLEKIAVGGMAEVFLAKSFGVAGFERLLVIKKILPHMAENEEFITMFVDEARIAASLSHSNIVQITELGREKGDFFIAMEFVHGKDLARILERLHRDNRCLPLPLAVLIACRICEGLDYAHRKKDADGTILNIVHRDVSPSNVLISYEGEVKLIDFGIARAQNRLGQTTAGALKGKFGYMSPEQARGLPLDRRSDIFSVGILLYEMLCGERLFGAEGGISTLEKVKEAEITPPTKRNRDIPPELEQVVLKALARNVEQRYQWASDMQDALSPFLLAGGTLITAKHLAAFMRGNFAEEMREEAERHTLYRRRGYPWIDEALREKPAAARDEEPAPQPALPPVEEKPATTPATGQESAAAAEAAPWPPAATSKPALRVTAGARSGSRPRMAPLRDPAPRPESVPPRTATRRRTSTDPLHGRSLPTKPAAGAKSTLALLAPFFAGLGVAVAAALAALLIFSGRQPAGEISQPPAPRTEPAGIRQPEPPKTDVNTEGPSAETTRLAPATAADTEGPKEKPDEKKPESSFGEERAGDVALRQRPSDAPAGAETGEMGLDLTEGTEKKSEPVERAEPIRTEGKEPEKPWATSERNAGEQPAAEKNQPALPHEVNRVASRSGKAQLVVNSEPPGAEVLLNGKPSGHTPLVLNQLDADINYFLVLKLGGFKPFMKGVKFSGEKQITVDARLVALAPNAQAAKGFLVANTTPWARVIVDGQDTGLWTPIPPTKKIELTAGPHKVLFRTEDNRELEIEVNIEPGQLTKVIQKIP